MKQLIYIVTITALSAMFTSCGVAEKKFDKATWNKRDDYTYANRESMVQDLMDNHLHKGMTYKNLTALIGQPENYANMKDHTIAYEIMVDCGWNIDPVEGKTLFIELAPDSTIISYKLEHWQH